MSASEITQEQQLSIQNYRHMGIDIEVKGDTAIVAQKRLPNGHILNNKALYVRAKGIFPERKIVPVVYSLDVDTIDLNWIKGRMEEFGIKRKDLVRQLALDKASLSKIFNGYTGLSKPMRATFFYYFLTYELNREFRKGVTY